MPSRGKVTRGLDPLRPLLGHALLVDHLALDAVREPPQLRRPLVERAHDPVADREVVADEIQLRLLPRREEHLVGVRHLDDRSPTSNSTNGDGMLERYRCLHERRSFVTMAGSIDWEVVADEAALAACGRRCRPRAPAQWSRRAVRRRQHVLVLAEHASARLLAARQHDLAVHGELRPRLLGPVRVPRQLRRVQDRRHLGAGEPEGGARLPRLRQPGRRDRLGQRPRPLLELARARRRHVRRRAGAARRLPGRLGGLRLRHQRSDEPGSRRFGGDGVRLAHGHRRAGSRKQPPARLQQPVERSVPGTRHRRGAARDPAARAISASSPPGAAATTPASSSATR